MNNTIEYIQISSPEYTHNTMDLALEYCGQEQGVFTIAAPRPRPGRRVYIRNRSEFSLVLKFVKVCLYGRYEFTMPPRTSIVLIKNDAGWELG